MTQAILSGLEVGMTSICRLFSVDSLGLALTSFSSAFGAFCSMEKMEGIDQGLRLLIGTTMGAEKLGLFCACLRIRF